MSSLKPRMVPTNIRADELIMDDSPYYCIPPFHGDPTQVHRGGGYPFHLVSQGRRVGTFNNWLDAKASVTGFPDSAHRGYNSIDDCVVSWQGLCVRGLHPHPVDPAFARPPNTSPRRSRRGSAQPNSAPVVKLGGTPELLADLRFSSPIRSPVPPSTPMRPSSSTPEEFVNFAIRGGGIVSSSAERSMNRYREMQRRGEEPDILVTRSFGKASRFALEDADEDGEGA